MPALAALEATFVTCDKYCEAHGRWSALVKEAVQIFLAPLRGDVWVVCRLRSPV